MGTSSLRSSSFAAWSDTARFTGSRSPARRRMPGVMPTVETVRWRAERPRSSCMRSTDVPGAVVVRERLAHPHEHDVRHPAICRPRPLRRPHDLLDDLAGGEVPFEAGLPGRAEAAPHGAARLARHAHCCAVGVEHQHGLDPRAALESPQPLDGRRPCRSLTPRASSSAGGSSRSSRGAQRLGQRRHLDRIHHLVVEGSPDLVDAVPRLALQRGGKRGPRDFVATGHVPEATGVRSVRD